MKGMSRRTLRSGLGPQNAQALQLVQTGVLLIQHIRPLQHLRRLSTHLGGAQVWAKREDVNSGLAFGGNKVRKLEYIVPDVLASGADTLVSIGGYQSNHTRQVAAVAAHLGLKARLVQEKWVPWDDPANTQVGNILLSRMMGADSRLDDAGFDIGIRDSWKQALADVEASGGTPYGVSHVAGPDGNPQLSADESRLAFIQGQRLALLTRKLNRS